MNIFLYAIIFIMGTVFGSFYTLAVYRIPRNIDIIKKHSYCPNCNHKLGFFELIPVLSYILLGGKCKYCKQKIRPRYLILEIMGGTVFVLFALIFDINIENISVENIMIYVFTILYLTEIILISGIDKEYNKLNKNVLAYGIIISILYMIYLYTIDATSIYRYAIYLAIFAILLLIDTFILKRYALESNIINLLTLLNIVLIFTEENVFMATIITTMFEILLYIIIEKSKQKNFTKKKIKISNIPIGFFIGTSNIIILLAISFTNNYII